jgi:hypothetical protein
MLLFTPESFKVSGPDRFDPLTVKVLDELLPVLIFAKDIDVVLGEIVRTFALPVMLTVLLETKPPPLMVSVAEWEPAPVGLYVTVTVAPLVPALWVILVLSIENTPVAPVSFSDKLPVKL